MRGEASVLGFATVILLSLGLSGCSEERQREDPPLVFADVSPILHDDDGCVDCHGGATPAVGYSVEDYLATIRCIPDPEGQPATLPVDESIETAPILAVLQTPSHADFLDAGETESLTTWVAQGAVPNRRSTHPGAWNDPRSADWHGTHLRQTNWEGIVDPESEDACGLCHPGSPAPVDDVVNYPPLATDCTNSGCHDLPGGVMACGTCHGDGERPYPPRDPCYFPGPPFGYAHDAHTESSPNNWSGLGCEACHFGIDFTMLDGDGLHANGTVNVFFQPAWGPDAAYDDETLACATTCHIRGGTTPNVEWNQEGLDLQCDACHQNPPAGHATISCNNCHRGINPAGTRLTPDAPHINGRVDVY